MTLLGEQPRAVSGPHAPVLPVREVGGTLAHDMRGVHVVWRREMIRFLRDPIRAVTQIAQPILYLFILGTGLAALASHEQFGGHISFRTFMYPGIISMTVLFTSMFSSMSIVWDREFGFLREMLVSPVRRWALILGKCLGGATVATCQGFLMLVLAGAVGVPYAPKMLIVLICEMALIAFSLNAFGMMLAARIKQMQAFQWLMTFLTMPMFFLSGAIYPLSALPTWLTVLTRLDPLAYAVDPLRRAVFGQLSVSPKVLRLLNPGVTWDAWRIPTLVELVVVAVFGLAAFGVAIREFIRTE